MMPKIEIIIDEQGNMKQRFFEFTKEDPACLCAEKLHGQMRMEGFEFESMKILSRGHEHTHDHAHSHGHGH